jgi:hypothetical protein
MCQEKYIFRAKILDSKIYLNFKQMNINWTRTYNLHVTIPALYPCTTASVDNLINF